MMSHTEFAWRSEVAACVPRGSDHVELWRQVPDLSAWRAVVAEEEEGLAFWEAHIQENRIGVLLEQVVEEGAVCSEAEIAARLQGCPVEWKAPLLEFLAQSPEAIREYLAYAWWCLVRIERERRTGLAEWSSEAASGSPEVLGELMFKWGARFRRHRWSW